MPEPRLLDTYLKQLRLPTFLQNYRKLAEDAGRADLTYERYLLKLAEQEIAQRELNQQARRIRAARFPVLKELADFDFSALPNLKKAQVLDLAQGGYIAKTEPILLVGHPGLGKTHIAIGLALAACQQGHKVRFYNAAGLVNEMLALQEKNQLSTFLTAALKFQVIVLDELGFIPFSSQGAQLLFQFCSTLYERVALIVTTNLQFADWVQIFQNERLTAALLDRLTDRATILEFVGESYRLRKTLKQKGRKEPAS
jgi:DNA replication protein DnaC